MMKVKGIIATLLLLGLLIPDFGYPQASVFSKPMNSVSAETISDMTEWNIKYMNAEKSYEESRNLKKIKVAVLDSGLDYDEDIPFVERKDFLNEEELHPLYQDYTGHGTSVAGLICAKKSDDRITGLAANVELYVGRILDAENKALVERVIEGIEWAMEKKVNIIHMSYGTQEYSEELEEVISEAYHQGILLVAAAGNSGTAAEDESTVEYPAAWDSVISVGATNSDNKKTDISSSGSELDVVAPGDQILSSGAFGGVVVEEGTSVSAAQVTGLAAVLWGRYPDKSNEFIKGLLVGSANAEAVDENCGNGLVDYEQSKENYQKMDAAYNAFKTYGASEKLAIEKAEESLGKNKKKIREVGEVIYVNGMWGKKEHNSFVENVDNINIVKAGAVYPDQVNSMKGMTAHPYFHGKRNYIANTQYLYAMAIANINAKGKDTISLTANDVYGEYNPLKGNVDANIAEVLDRTLLDLWARYGKNHIDVSTCRKKGYALLGVAIHNATDAMSHSACIDLKEYGGWQRVVHKYKKGKKKGADYWFNEWTKSNQPEPLKSIAEQWKKLSIADDTKNLEPFFKLSEEITKYLIQYMKEGKKQCYECFSIPINDYLKGKPSDKLGLAELNENWAEVSSEKKNFGISKKITKLETRKVKARDLYIYSYRGEVRLKIKNMKKNTLYRISKGGKKRTYFGGVGTVKKKYWILPSNTYHINVQSCSIKGLEEKKNFNVTATVKFSKKGIKGVKGKIKNKSVILEQPVNLPTKGFTRKEYKLTGWYQLVNGNTVYYKKGKKFTAIKKETITLYPYFKRKKGKKKAKGGKKK